MEGVSRELTEELTCYHDVFGDTAAGVGVIVESLTGVRAALLLRDPKDLQNRALGAQGLASDFPPKLCGRTGLCRAEHGQV